MDRGTGSDRGESPGAEIPPATSGGVASSTGNSRDSALPARTGPSVLRAPLALALASGIAIALLATMGACGDGGFSEGYLEATRTRTKNQLTNEVRLRAMQYAPVEMSVDLSDASPRERSLLRALLRASALADEIFWRQTGSLAVPYREEIEASFPRDHIVYEFYMMQMGPYDRLDHDRAYMDVPPKPPGAGFYPADMTEEEFRAWIDRHPEDRASFLDPYTVIRRRGDSLVAVPYHEEYRDLVEPLATALREAASHTEHPRLRRYLELKAEAVLTDEYYDADTAWVKMDDAPFDVVIGPFEVYEDRLLNLKAAYEATVELVDSAASGDLARYREHLDELEAALPYPDSMKPESVDLTATFTVVRDIYRGGQISTGYQPVAANLPNDPRVHTTVGTKKTFWKNVMDARFDSIITPIGRELLARDQRDALSADAFFDFVLFHELAHGLGPRYVRTEGGRGQRVPVNQRLGDLYSWIEENKADLVGLFALRELRASGVLDGRRSGGSDADGSDVSGTAGSDVGDSDAAAAAEVADSLEGHLVSYLASLFRTIRFGTGEAHGLAALVSLNWYLEHGGVTHDAESGRFSVEPEALLKSVEGLTHELLMIEATGDRERAERLREDYGSEPDLLADALDRLADLPVDVAPLYEIRW